MAFGEDHMRKAILAASAALLLAASPAMAQQKTIKIGFISTFSGPVAVIGEDMRNSFELALDHMGRKMGGLPVEVIYEDDGFKPEVGKQKTEKLIESDKVDFISGYIWSNVLLASLKPVVDSKTFLVIANAGPSQIAGELCSPTVFSTSWQNDQTPQAVGLYMNQKGVKSVFLIGPNYAAGKDMLAGVAATFKGKVVGQELTTWPAQLDFSAELAKAKAANPDAIFVFYPGRAGVQFLTQYAQAGLKDKIPLVGPGFLTDGVLEAAGSAAQGVETALHYADDLKLKRDREFRLAYAKAFKLQPDVYAVQGYDSGLLLAAGLKAVRGDVTKKKELIAAMEKATVDSPRGKWHLSKAHNPVQDMYLRKVVGTENRYESVAVKALDDDPAAMGACKMG